MGDRTVTETPTTSVEAEPRLDQIATALAAFQAEMPTVAKTKTASVKSDKGSYSYTYAGLADVTEAAMPLLSKHGLSFVTMPGQGTLTGLLMHSSGQSLRASLPIAGSTPQQMGSALTYMRRYLLGCMTGLVTDDDEDGQIASAAPRRKADRRAEPTASAAPVQTRTAPVQRPQGDEAITSGQLSKIGAAMRDLAITDRADALAYVARAIGREVQSRNELTKTEAHQVIESLEFDLNVAGQEDQ